MPQIRTSIISVFALFAVPAFSAHGLLVKGKNIQIEFNQEMHSRLIAVFGKERVIGGFTPSESIVISGKKIDSFVFQGQRHETIHDKLGAGVRTTITGTAPSLKKTVIVTTYDRFPRMAFFDVAYTNTGRTDLSVEGWTNQHYSITAQSETTQPAFWSYQSGSYEKRPDWVLPLKPGFYQENFLGMNAADYGGGTPVVDVWCRDVGIAVGHVELVPKLVSLPVAAQDPDHASVAVKFKHNQVLKPGATLKTFRTFAAVHQGDYFEALRDYRAVMMDQGVQFAKAPDSAYGPIWCAWGYGRKMTPKQLFDALPVVKKLGFTWVTLDDGWQTNQGDWLPQPKKYPRGDADMRALVDKIHAQGFKAQLWWAPLTADPNSELAKKHPEMLLLNADGSKRKISYWNSWYLCPADPAVVKYHEAIVEKALKVWGFDGLKLDGQHMNGVPRCYNPAHHHKKPEDSVEAAPKFFQAIYDTALRVKPDAVVEFCPCGTAYSFFTLPFLNMSVASDPESAWQVRTKAKTLKALEGNSVAYFGDHVDLYHDDFASALGVGGVVGSNFTWPEGSAEKKRNDLTPAREELFEKWLHIYKEKMLSRGEYLGGLYDIGFDRPETHAIRKNGAMYYAFYAPHWSGKIVLRGLADRRYHVTDYVNNKDLGTVHGPSADLTVSFDEHLLVEAKPE
ncbi:MAG TPA: glycoside hydrolase family 36 protein [Bryobacteraceae bacterium]|jgi:alpha-galactosidase